MNTTELINDLEKYYSLKKQYPDTVEKVVTTLRQLQAENDELKELLEAYREDNKK